MIDIAKAVKMFHEKYKERYGEEQKLEPGEITVSILKNCIMIITMKEDRTLGIEFTGDKPFIIDESLDMYTED